MYACTEIMGGTARQALHHATLQSARAVGLGAEIGSLAPGRRADIILVDITGPHTQPIHDLAATLVHSAKSSDVRTTIVDGRVLMRDRELLTIDINAATRLTKERIRASDLPLRCICSSRRRLSDIWAVLECTN